MEPLLINAARRAEEYLDEIRTRRVSPGEEAINALNEFDQDLPMKGLEAEEVIRLLDEVGSPATVATAGSRYFGFVIGVSDPVQFGLAELLKENAKHSPPPPGPSAKGARWMWEEQECSQALLLL